MTCLPRSGFSVDQPQAVPVSAPQCSGFSDGMYQVSESLQTLNEFNAEDILNIKQEDTGSSSDYYSLESSPNSNQHFLETPTPEIYNNPHIYDPPMPYFNNGHSTYKGKSCTLNAFNICPVERHTRIPQFFTLIERHDNSSEHCLTINEILPILTKEWMYILRYLAALNGQI